MKKKAYITIIMSIIALSCSGCGSSQITEADLNKLPSYSIAGSYSYDTSDLQQRVDNSECVFVAKVISYDGSRLEDIAYREDEKEGKVKLGTPYTDYTVQVTENIKGELDTQNPIKIIKDGGLAPDGKSIYIWDNDELPKTGNTYIFCATKEPDGSVLICGPFSNIILKQGSEGEDILKEYKQAAVCPEISEESR